MAQEPEIFTRDATETQMTRARDMLSGYGLTGLDVPEGVIPMSLRGTQLGIVAKAFLLGLTEHPRAISPLLDILSYDDEPLIRKLAEACNQEIRYVRWDFSFANRPVVADALDRVLMACAENETIDQDALSVARQYKQWRQARGLTERGVVDIYPYDAARTPYHLPGKLTGGPKNIETCPLELPLNLGTSNVDLYGFDEETLSTIIEWGGRFDEALGK